MKNISAALSSHLSKDLTTIAYMVKISCINGNVIGLTSHDKDLKIDNVIYKADGALSFIGSIENINNLDGKDLNVEGVLDSDLINEDDIKAGVYDNARIDIFICNWKDLSQGVLKLRRGWIGDISILNGSYKASFLPFKEMLNKKIGETYTPECRFDLGDDNCLIDCNAYKTTGSVTSIIDDRKFVDNKCTKETGYYKNAKLTWISGDNIGVISDVHDWDKTSQEFTLWLNSPYQIKNGDEYEVIAGCDKRFSTCKSKFNNSANFGGFPHLPGIGKILQYPS